MKHFVISVGLFLVSSLASANLVQHTITPPVIQKNNAVTAVNSLGVKTFSPQANASITDNKASKTEAIYSTLFNYSSHINQTIDRSGLTVFWNSTLISTAIEAAKTQQRMAEVNTKNDNDHELLQFVANSLNDNYVADGDDSKTHINEVPLPAAIWLFSSALLLFGFARRSTV